MASASPQRLTREQQREQTLERLLTAAAELFGQHGIAETSIEEIAERAGFSRGAFYSNFADKDALVLELIERHHNRSMDETNAIMESTTSPDEFMQRLFEWSHRIPEDQASLGIEYILYAVRNAAGRPRMKELNDRLLAQHARLAEQQFVDLDVDMPLTPHDAARVLMGLDEGFALLRLIDPETFPMNMWPDTVAFLNEAVLALAEKRARESPDPSDGN